MWSYFGVLLTIVGVLYAVGFLDTGKRVTVEKRELFLFKQERDFLPVCTYM
jgi:hypothetical protein